MVHPTKECRHCHLAIVGLYKQTWFCVSMTSLFVCRSRKPLNIGVLHLPLAVAYNLFLNIRTLLCCALPVCKSN